MKLTPQDYKNPDWKKIDRVHNWRNYISMELQSMWNTFTDDQKAAIARSAEESADMEEWE